MKIVSKYLLIFVINIFISNIASAQNINLEQLVTGKPFKVSGTVSTNSVYFNSNQSAGREPFTYLVQGALNFGLYQFSMPVSYSYSNQGDNFNYQIPFKFNRLSLHPKYKWAQAHIGDASMTFSPYSLSAHQFSGGGIELTPKGGFKFSAMTGRLLKATEDDGDPRTVPAFRRMGYGAKIGFDKKKFAFGLIGFYAKDDINSIALVPDDRGVTPKENLVIGLEGSYKINKDLEFKAEYTSSSLTKDTRATDSEVSGQGLSGGFFNNKTSTEFYNALKAGLKYKIKKSSFGLEYERIDPGYETLGAYFFNNDFENITLNTTTTLFKDKVNLSFNIGYQRDDLNHQKESKTSRTVGAVNVAYNASERLNIVGSYSNFTTFTNLKVDQFDIINDDNLLDNQRDALDYKQLSQNANVNVNYVIAKKEKIQQNINFNYALAGVSNEQGGVVRIGDASTFHNFNSSYTLGFPKKKLNITPAINVTYNTIGRENATTWGPTLAISKKFFKNKLNTSFASSYSNSANSSSNTSVLNFRASAIYVYQKKHNFNLSAIQLFKQGTLRNTQNLTLTFGYNYAFDLNSFKVKLPPSREKIKKEKEPRAPKIKKAKKAKKIKGFKFSYKEHNFAGVPEEIEPKVLEIGKLDKFSTIVNITKIANEIKQLEEKIKDSKSNKKQFKKASIAYLKYLYNNKNFKDTYDRQVFKSLKKLYNDARKMSLEIEKSYVQIQGKVNDAVIKDQIDIDNLKKKENQYNAHLWMMKKLEEITFKDVQEDKGLLEKFKEENLNTIFEMLQNDTTEMKIKIFLEIGLIKLYHKEALKSSK